MHKAQMTSRERMLAALRQQDVDYVPCCPSFSASLLGPGYSWAGRAESLPQVVSDLGLDAVVNVSMEPSWHPDVTATTWRESAPGERWPILHKRIDTPAGPLTAAIRVTDDLEHPDDLPLHSDWNVSRYVKSWIQTEDDLARYQYVRMPPTDRDIAAAHGEFMERKRLANSLGLATHASIGAGLTHGLQLFGPERAIIYSMDRPELIERFLEIDHAATMRCSEVAAGWGVDIIRRNGFYETCDHWSPGQLRRWLVPRLRREVSAMGSGGAVTTYTVCTGIMPMLDILAELPFDAYHSIEPALGNQNMHAVAQRLCSKHAIWGGVSGPIHIGEGTPEVARQAVRDAFSVFGSRGLVLSAVPSTRAHWPWENSLAMFDEWRKLRGASS